MPTISFSIGGEKHDISGKSGKEVVGMVVKEIKKKKIIVRKKTTFHEQMKKLRADNEYRNVFPNDNWSAQDYKDIFWCIDKGYLVQNCGTSFIINEEWEGDDVYAEEFLEEEEEKCDKCDIRLGIYDGNYEMKVDLFGKTMCGKCALGKA
jgi:hypothetical protein